MSGSLEVVAAGESLPVSTVLSLSLDDADRIAVTSRRKLGHIALVESVEAFTRSNNLGPDALDPSLDSEWFRNAFESKRGSLKSALMDQGTIAGIGNIYSDEILFQSGIHPKTQIGRIRAEDLDRVFATLRSVLRKAIDRSITTEDLDNVPPKCWLLAQRTKGGRCPRCGELLQTTKVGGRTAYYCGSCQGG